MFWLALIIMIGIAGLLILPTLMVKP